MAKEVFLCGKCKENWVTVIGRNRKEAERRAKWLMDSEVCSECKQSERDEENKKAIEFSSEMGWCELKGSEKQVAWANTIRKNKIGLLLSEYNANLIDEEIIKSLGINKEDLVSFKKAIILVLSNKECASFWIDHNRLNMSVIILSIKNELAYFIADREKDEEERKEENRLMEAVLKEETVRPEDPCTNHIATVMLIGSKIAIKFEVYNKSFIEIVSGEGYQWSEHNKWWWREIKVFDTNKYDRAAEVMALLLGNRFIVRCSNNIVRQKAIDGSWEPRVQRQICLADKEKLRFIWFDSKKLISEMMCLAGAKLDYSCKHGSWIVPAVDHDQILDFAEINAFEISKEAMQLIELKKNQYNLIPVATPKKTFHEYPEIDDELKFSVIDKIDESLLDD